MSISLTTGYRINCDGDGRWGCPALFDSPNAFSLARDVRADAKAGGWTVNIPNPGARRRLDTCPLHAEGRTR
ncbi:hypothetical protein CHO01_29140 [Cellulomonas hominis]|uniref:Uncharacterized protein n=1 Tax=Cellulomonas hominis TaxID=156981 RepID=A0A511FIY9_9CELL|nr:hypothetical protein [Cellulomonas hominis]MBB5474737.1 hypothetical protein [Cellulomonas hominis]NKY05393.1 hypothetical protein [Cellulomonas hominis]GEL47798.1 hypothetical protein CHO01_29140 [Cellulomonas hominis]